MLHLTLCLLLALPASAATRLKVATLAPEGSTWTNVFHDMNRRLVELTEGRVSIRLYAGGVAGDEVDVVRKMRVGQLQGAAITSVGLSEIQQQLMVLQAPGLFRNWEELDHARAQLSERFQGLLREKGFEVVMWGDAGFNRFFSNKRITSPADMQGTKPWCWTQDGVYQAYFGALGVQPVSLGVPEVLPSLQTGLIDAFAAAPLPAVALQWFSRAKYMLDIPQTVTIGAVVFTKEALDKLDAKDRAAMAQVAAEFSSVMAQAVRKDNEVAVEAIRKAKVEIVRGDSSVWQKQAEQAADAAAGKVYPAPLLAEVRKSVAAYRAR
jgi:TRAP-type C4-dicarboxylate transport system substrate-binding protein